MNQVAKEIRNIHIEEYVDLVNDLRPYVGEDSSAPETSDVMSLFSGCPEMCRKVKPKVSLQQFMFSPCFSYFA